MTPLMRAMLDDILAHPRDDTLRLSYAEFKARYAVDCCDGLAVVGC